MTDPTNQINDVLLTALGMMLIPMNLVTGVIPIVSCTTVF